MSHHASISIYHSYPIIYIIEVTTSPRMPYVSLPLAASTPLLLDRSMT
jgi:hypothetical protein